MDTKMVEHIRQNLANNTNDELLHMWKENDRERWSESAFEAVKQILTERGIELPAQGAPIVKGESVEERKTDKRSIGRAMIAFGIVGAGAEAALYASELIFVQRESVLSIYSCHPVVQGVIAALLGCLWYLHMETRRLRSRFPLVVGSILAWCFLGGLGYVVAQIIPNDAGKAGLRELGTELLFILPTGVVAYLLSFAGNRQKD